MENKMKDSNEILGILESRVSEQTYNEIIQIVESSLFNADKRGDL